MEPTDRGLSLADAAATLYKTPAPELAMPPKAAPTPPPAERVAAALYPPRVEVPPEYHGFIPAHRATLTDTLGYSAQEALDYELGFATSFGRSGLDPYSVGKLLYDEKIAADVADARGHAEPDEAQRLAWAEESRRETRATYGDRTDRLFARARAWMATQPDLTTLLERRGIGGRPDITRAIVDHVHRNNL
jgi:hypothetical protein